MLNSSVYNYFLNEEIMNQGSASFIDAYEDRHGCCEDSLKIQTYKSKKYESANDSMHLIAL